MGDDLLVLLAEAFPRIRNRMVQIPSCVTSETRENEIVFGMGISAVRDRSHG